MILVGLFFVKSFDGVDFFEAPSAGFYGIISAVAVIFFAYIGFEDVANLSEEARNPTKTIPRGLLLSLAFSTVLYILVAVSSTALLGWEKLSVSKAPLADVVAQGLPQASGLMSVIALFATSSTVLVMLIVASRMLYGVSTNHALPNILSRLHPVHCTPYVSIALVGILSFGSLFLGSIKTVALLTDIGIFITYFFINASLIVLRFRSPKHARPFRSPLNICGIPVLASIGVLSCGLMVVHFEVKYVLFEFVVLCSGILIYYALKKD